VTLAPPAYLPHLDQAAADIAQVLATGDLDAPVPACGSWTLTDLTHHLGGIHRWARRAVAEGREGAKVVDDPPRERDALLHWFREGADALATTLRATDPDAPCWTIAPPPTAAFWFRRQTHETAMHAGDAAASQGGSRPYGTSLALDGIDEIATMQIPRQIRLGRIAPLPVAVAVEAREGGSWVLGDGDPVATVSGPAETLLLVLWHRRPLAHPDVTVAGDRASAESVLGAALTP
jgi:uncharacterized protein (TIGR03083 family)